MDLARSEIENIQNKNFGNAEHKPLQFPSGNYEVKKLIIL